MPASTSSPRSSGRRRARGAALALACFVLVGACADPEPPPGAAADGLLVLVADAEGTSLVRWEGSSGEPISVTLPDDDATWISGGRADVLAVTLAGGGTATSDPIRTGRRLKWRTVKAAGPDGKRIEDQQFFATWDPEGGRFATLAGDLVSAGDIRVVLVDPTLKTALEIPLDRGVLPAPPAWIDGERLVVVTGDTAAPLATIVDTTTGDFSDGPSGDRLIATSGDGRVIATVAGRRAPIVIHDTAGWLAGDGSSIASIEPPDVSTTVIAMALDATGDRLAVAWAAGDGTVSIAVHVGRSGWRRAAEPAIGTARGAVVAWRR